MQKSSGNYAYFGCFSYSFDSHLFNLKVVRECHFKENLVCVIKFCPYVLIVVLCSLVKVLYHLCSWSWKK